MKLKLRRKTIIPFVLIVIACLVLLPILSYFINKNIENFDSSSYPANGKIDRILFSKGTYDRNVKDSNGNLNDISGQYGYCLGGNIKCNGSSKLVPFFDDYKYGSTYSAYCSDNSKPSCVNNYYSKLSDASMVNHINEKDAIFKTTGINVMDSLQFTGFIGPYDYAPFVREIDTSSNKAITYYMKSDKSLSSANKSICDLISPSEQMDCENYYYKLDKSVTTNNGSNNKGDDDKDDDDVDDADDDADDTNNDDDTNGSSCDVPIPCIANFGTEIGENLCCGQTGVLQNTKYVCPSTAPKCSNFSCGKKFGTCSA
jgi:hypothetical protein